MLMAQAVKIDPDAVEIPAISDELRAKVKAGETLTDAEQKSYDDHKLARKVKGLAVRGFNWRPLVVQTTADDNREVAYTSPKLCKTEGHAIRYAQRNIRNFEQRGDFEKGGGMIKPAKITKFPGAK